MDDRISTLPDDVLCHILSFLPTKHAASTSVLSKRWRNLVAFVPNLDFNDSAFLHPEEGIFASFEEKDEIRRSFMNFVDRVLDLQGDSHIEKFSLKCKYGVNPDRLDRWISNVLQRGVSDLELFNNHDDIDDFYVPQELFVSRKLVELKIKRVTWLPEAKCIFLPMLKSLVIYHGLICWETLEMLLPRFPVLEELVVHHLKWNGSGDTLSSASLKKLTIIAEGCYDGYYPESISFDTPSLLYLEYSDFVAEDYPKLNLADLVEARLDLIVYVDHFKLRRSPDNDVFLKFGNLLKLMISGIRNVQKLSLSSDTFELFSLCCESMPVFNNLKMLQIRCDKERGWQAMPVLLKNCPHLETLLLEGLLHYVTDKCGDACDCITREDKGRSLISCPVKKIQIKWFTGTKREMGMIEHFLESFPCLKEMEIYAEGKYEHVVKMVNLYNEIYQSCDVRLLVCRDVKVGVVPNGYPMS